jgi:hypothetical protein
MLKRLSDGQDGDIRILSTYFVVLSHQVFWVVNLHDIWLISVVHVCYSFHMLRCKWTDNSVTRVSVSAPCRWMFTYNWMSNRTSFYVDIVTSLSTQNFKCRYTEPTKKSGVNKYWLFKYQSLWPSLRFQLSGDKRLKYFTKHPSTWRRNRHPGDGIVSLIFHFFFYRIQIETKTKRSPIRYRCGRP